MNARKFQAKKDAFFGSVIWGSNIMGLATVGIMISEINRNGLFLTIIILIPLVAAIILLTWVWFTTNYKIEHTSLYCQSGPFHRTLDINKITKIIKNKTLWAGFKPALAQNGLIIKYGKWNDIYISPKDKDSFIAQLKHLNDKIEVVG